jgi:hypothetical protein
MTSSLSCRDGGFRVRHLQTHRLADDLRKRFEMPGCRPHFELSVAATMELNDDVFAAVVNLEA